MTSFYIGGAAIGTTAISGEFFQEEDNTWWDPNYPIRYRLKADPLGYTVPTGHPATLQLPISFITTGKVREDLQDIVILYNTGTQIAPIWNVLGNEASHDDNIIYVTFPLYKSISSPDTNYYLHVGNGNLVNPAIKPSYTPNPFPIQINQSDGRGLAFTRPNEDWVDGESRVINARAAFTFRGPNVRLLMDKDINYGIMELIFDDEAAQYIDLYNDFPLPTYMFERTGLDSSQHIVRIRVTGDKSPMATDRAIKIIRFEFATFVEVTLFDEELRPAEGTSKFSYITGA